MRNALEIIIKQLVSLPEEVTVTQVDGQSSIILEVKCNKQDIGKIIGKSGQTIDAIRKVLIAMAGRTGSRVSLEIIE